MLPAILERPDVLNSVTLFGVFKPDVPFGRKFLTFEPVGDFRFLAISLLAVGRYANIDGDHLN